MSIFSLSTNYDAKTVHFLRENVGSVVAKVADDQKKVEQCRKTWEDCSENLKTLQETFDRENIPIRNSEFRCFQIRVKQVGITLLGIVAGAGVDYVIKSNL